MRLPIPGTYGLFEPESGALMARRAVAAVVDDAFSHGVDFAVQSVKWPDPEIDAAVFVFACGPWLPKLFPEMLGNDSQFLVRGTPRASFFGNRRFGLLPLLAPEAKHLRIPSTASIARDAPPSAA